MKYNELCDVDIIAAIGVHPSTFYWWLKDGGETKSGVKRALYDELKGGIGAQAESADDAQGAAESRVQFWADAA